MSGQIPALRAELLELTVILSVFNEVENLPLLWPELIGVLNVHWRHVEIIFVDDMSTDGSAEWIRELARQDGRVDTSASRGMLGSPRPWMLAIGGRGPNVVTMDSDLQSDPADIPRLVAALAEADAATGWRVHRHVTWLKRLSSRIANFVRNRVTPRSNRS
jgi:glycosyltransferase involved in cell wall biosynthesis